MFAQQLASAIEAVRPSQLDQIARQLWQAHAAAHLTAEEAQQLAEQIEARRALSRPPRASAGLGAAPSRPAGRPSIFRPRRHQPAKRHPERIARRRGLAATYPMPPQLAAHFTTCELAVLRIVRDEVSWHGRCELSLAELAARAGTCRSLAQRVLRVAASLGLLSIEERKRPGAPNLTNVVRIVSREWKNWIERGPKGEGVGSRKMSPTESSSIPRGNFAPSQPLRGPKRGFGEKGGAARASPS